MFSKALTLVLLFAISQVLSSPLYQLPNEWRTWKNTHQKNYLSRQEESNRYNIWVSNLKMIMKHNKLYDAGLHSYNLAMNAFSDLTHTEFKKYYLGSKFDASKAQKRGFISHPSVKYDVETPEEIDWVKKGYVTPVKNQGNCGSCWAFSTTGSLEGALKRKTGKLVSLSEQQLVDCSGDFGNMGCNGGTMDAAFQYITSNHGLDSEKSYPYEAQRNDCRFNPHGIAATVSKFVDIQGGSEDDLQKAVGLEGPVSVAIDASHASFQFYHSGVYYDEDCSATQLDHGVLAVGYGKSDQGHEYWKVKNSWTSSWGHQGYIYMSRNRNNNCGIASMASYPVV